MTVRAFLAATAAALILGSAPASATDLYSRGGAPKDARHALTGFYAALGAGYTSSAASVAGVSFDVSGQGAFATLRLGYDHEIAHNVILGVFAEGLAGNFTYDGTGFAADYSGAIGARIGTLIGGTLLYLTGGYSITPLEGSGQSKGIDINLDGYFAGGGIEAPLGNGWSLVPEARITFAADTVSGITIEDDAVSVTALLKKTF